MVLFQATAVRNKEVFSYGTFVDITFNLVIRRRALFYTGIFVAIPYMFGITALRFSEPTDTMCAHFFFDCFRVLPAIRQRRKGHILYLNFAFSNSLRAAIGGGT